MLYELDRNESHKKSKTKEEWKINDLHDGMNRKKRYERKTF